MTSTQMEEATPDGMKLIHSYFEEFAFHLFGTMKVTYINNAD